MSNMALSMTAMALSWSWDHDSPVHGRCLCSMTGSLTEKQNVDLYDWYAILLLPEMSD
jgi:hypothetical protein